MDDNKLLIAFIVVVVALLALPVVMKQVNGSAAVATGGATGATGAAVPAVSDVPPELMQPPLLNEANLIGSEWQIQVEDKYKLKVTLQAGGTIYATHPLAKSLTGRDYVEGRWRVEGDRLMVSTFFGGNNYDVSLKISGMKLFYIDQRLKHKEVERYH